MNVVHVFLWLCIIWTAIIVIGSVVTAIRVAIRKAQQRRRMNLLAWSRKSQAEYEDRWIAHIAAGCTPNCRGPFHEEA